MAGVRDFLGFYGRCLRRAAWGFGAMILILYGLAAGQPPSFPRP